MQKVKQIPIYSFTAFSGSGKTTLLVKIISELKHRGYRVAAIKHDAHDFDIDYEGKDSWKMTKAGADITIISSATKTAIMENRPVSLEKIIASVGEVDIIVTEGWKNIAWERRIAICRAACCKPLVIKPEDCFAVITDLPIVSNRPCFALDDIVGLTDLIEADMRKEHNDRLFAVL